MTLALPLLIRDPVGRLTMAVSSSGSAASETYAYNSGTNQLASVTDASGTRTVSYDARGNTVAEARPGGVAVAASYDGHARLESYDRSNIGAQTYAYNGLGDRVRVVKPTGTRHFVYDSQGRVVAEYGASAGEVKAEFIWALPPAANDNSPFGGDDGIVGYAPLALVTTNTSSQLTLYWVHGNHLGVPIVTTNALGQVVDPGNDFLRPGFPGQSQVLSDLYYNRARDYDPVLGRYIQADPIGLLGGANPYLYAGADPVNMIDPDGRVPLNVVTGIIGAGVSGGGNLIGQLATNGWRIDCVDVSDVIIATVVGGATGFVAPFAAPGVVGAIGLGGVSNIAQTGLSNLANGRPTTGRDVLVAGGIGAASGLVGGGVGKPPSGKPGGGLISDTGDALHDRAINEGSRIRQAVGTRNLIRNGASAAISNLQSERKPCGC